MLFSIGGICFVVSEGGNDISYAGLVRLRKIRYYAGTFSVATAIISLTRRFNAFSNCLASFTPVNESCDRFDSIRFR